jgi:hypothetical protein
MTTSVLQVPHRPRAYAGCPQLLQPDNQLIEAPGLTVHVDVQRFLPDFRSGTSWNSSLRPRPMPLVSSNGSSGCRIAA